MKRFIYFLFVGGVSFFTFLCVKYAIICSLDFLVYAVDLTIYFQRSSVEQHVTGRIDTRTDKTRDLVTETCSPSKQNLSKNVPFPLGNSKFRIEKTKT